MKRFRGPFFQIRIYDNRIEFGKGIWPIRQRVTIPFNSLASAEVASLTRRLVLKTRDGKQYRFGFFFWWRANKIRNAIAERM